MAKNIKCATILIFAFGITTLIKGMVPEDLQVLVNDSAVIRCSPNRVLNVQWHHTSVTSPEKFVYAGGNFYGSYITDRFRAYNDPNRNIYTLVISNVTHEDAGLYECKDDILSGVFGSTQLIILDSSPVCNSNMHPDGFIGPNECDLQKENMTFSCSVSFTGKTSPILMWRSFNGSQSFINSTCTTQSNHINCSFTLKAEPEYDGSVFICETKESNGARFNCSTEVVKVQYFSADSETSARKVHDNVSCIVNSNLETRYNWKVEQDGRYVFLSSERTIVMKEPGIYRCDVEYSIRNNTCAFLTSVVNASVDSTNEKVVTDSSGFQKEKADVLAIALSIVLSIVLIVVIVAFVIYAKRIKDAKKKRLIDDTDAKTKVPLNDLRRTRLETIRPRLADVCNILQIGPEIIRKLKESLVINDDVDAAVDASARFERLLSTVSQRMDDAFVPLKEALAGINPILSDYIEKGEIVAVDITTEMPHFDEPLSNAFNDAVTNRSELFPELRKNAIFMVAAKPSNSIEVLIYCGEPENMRKFIEIFNSDSSKGLESILSDVLNKLLTKIQPSNVDSLGAKVYIRQNEVALIGQFADKNVWLRDKSKIRKSSSALSFSIISLRSDQEVPPLSNEEAESVRHKRPVKSTSNGQSSDSSDEDEIIMPTLEESKKEDVTGITESNWKDILRTNYADLLAQINSNGAEDGLEGEFRKLKLFTPLQIRGIWGRNSNIERTKAILSLLERGDLKRFLAVRSALWKAGQTPVVEKHMSFVKEHLLTPDNRYNEPLKESCRYQMLVNWNKLLLKINYDEGLIGCLKGRGTLTGYQTAVLEDLSSDTSKVNYLLRLLETGSQQHFDDFCDCLKKNNQDHVVNKYLTPKFINRNQDEIPESFKDVEIHFNIKTKPIRGRVLVISNRCYLNQNRSEMHRNEANLNIFFEEKLVFQQKPIFDAKLVTNEGKAQDMMKTLETEQQSQKDYDVFLMVLFSYGNSREIFTTDGQSLKINDLFDMFDNEKCPKLKGKPKLFIIQTFERDGVLDDSPSLDAKGNLSVNFNLKKDMAVVYATVKGEPENGREVTGKLFIRCLLKVFFNKIQDDFSDIIKEVLELLRKEFKKITPPKGDVQSVQQLTKFQTTLAQKVFLVEQK